MTEPLEVLMAGMTRMDIKKLVNRYIGVSGGYLGDFSYRSHADFYPEYCNLDIDPHRYEGTTRQRFEKILETSPPHVQAKIIRGILEKYPPRDADTLRLASEFRDLAGEMDAVTSIPIAATVFTTEVVERAIRDIEILLTSRGAVSGVDRVHTALHGYLRKLCEDMTITYEAGATMTAIFKRLRADHPAFKVDGPRAQDITQVMRAMSAIMDALNPLRNNASVAHPNDDLLDEPEAMLTINSARTILNYLDAKLVRYENEQALKTKDVQIVATSVDDEIPF